jgi:hypothetical protein
MSDDIRNMLERGWRAEWGYRIAGHAERQHRHPDIAYRAFWIDAGCT